MPQTCPVPSLRALALAAVVIAGCGDPPTEPTPDADDPTPLQLALAAKYQERFGQRIPRPAVFDPFSASTCTPRHVTSTAWLGDGTTRQLLTLYTSADGTAVELERSVDALAPAGRLRMLTVLVRHSNVGDDGMALWTEAQEGINSDYASFAAARGLGAPIVAFENTTVIVSPESIPDPRSRPGVTAALASIGQSAEGYDILASVNLDPSRSEGGFAVIGSRFLFIGRFSSFASPLAAADYVSVARALYHHEVVHLWGWPGTHDWATGCQSGFFGFNLRVPPVLLGWEDVDGDRVPEILDSTPYGR
jgi:hypothetical protein